ncbi:protein kinase domain-containing protein [Pantanalinema sp. GBBB05]|uniref:protein kinase domain-containing protein n=1 Tax=Pantanalinema sp. GBBB05 TaxID=2604139 RepID=UPI001DCAF974|nr:protein kinase [Pantanalinema sp. GBBB05]
MVILTLLHPQHQTPLRQWQFPTESTIRVGRALDNQVILDDLLVSRHHLELHKIELPIAPGSAQAQPCWQLVNHSSNGTYLNGRAVSQGLILTDAKIQLAQGGPCLKVQVRDTGETTAAIASSTDVGNQMTGLLDPSLKRVGSPVIVEASHQPCTHEGNTIENLFCIYCGQPIRVEQTVRHYQILRILGRGGMGTIYLVWHQTGVIPETGRPLGKLQVLKEMNADIARIPKARELFEREARTLQTLNHPGIPKFHDSFIESGKKYLVMELVHGQDLERRVRQFGTVKSPQAIAWMMQTCDVLDYLHNRPVPIIHRDIKPGNLLVRTLDHRIVVLDFGAVKAVGASSATRIGAEGYSAPEQIQGNPVIQSDLYAIGPSLVFLLTGETPRRFKKPDGQGYRFNLDGITAIAPSLRRVIERVTSPEPSDRYLSAKALSEALARCL